METYHSLFSELVVLLRYLEREWCNRWDTLNRSSLPYSAATNRANHPGRPKFAITTSQLEYLEGMSFNWTQISQMLGVSRTTTYRRRVELSMSTDKSHSSSVDDDELEHLLRQIRHETPALGKRLIMGKLKSWGIKVSRSRVRTCIHQIDPINTVLRWKGYLASRQPYSVPGPNSLWHIGKQT